MTKYIITAPDGKNIEVETDLKMTKGLARKVLADAGYSNKNKFLRKLERVDKEKALEATEGLLSSFDEAARFGLGKKLGAAVYATGSYPVDRAAQLFGIENTPSWSDRYNEIVEDVDTARKNISNASPATTLYTEVLGTLKNPLYKKGAEIINEGIKTGRTFTNPALKRVADTFSNTKKVGNQMIVGGTVNTALAGTDNLIRGKEDATEDALAYGIAGTLTPPLGKAANRILRSAGTLTNWRLGKNIDESAKNEKVNKIVKELGEGFGDKEAIGIAARKPLEESLQGIKDIKDRLYKEAWERTNPEGVADISKIEAALEEHLPHLNRKTRNVVNDFMKEYVLPQVNKEGVVDRVTLEQLDDARSVFGAKYNELTNGLSGKAKKRISGIYEAMRESFLDSVAKNGQGEIARKKMEEAMNKFQSMLERRSDYKLYEEMLKDRSGDTSIASNILSVLSSNKADTKKLNRLVRADKQGNIKSAVAGYIRNAKDFNKLSPKGKEFVYGDRLQEAEEAFNSGFGKKIQNVLNFVADKNKANSPYLLGLIRLLLNK